MQGWAAHAREASLAPDAVDTLLANRGMVADMFVCPGRSIKSLDSQHRIREQRRSISVADFRREDERPRQRQLGTSISHRPPLALKMPAVAFNTSLRDLQLGRRQTSHVPTPHPLHLGGGGASPCLNEGGRGRTAGAALDMSYLAGEDSKMQKLQAAVEPTGPSRFIGHQHSSKYGRSWGKYNPVHVPIIDGIEDVELELSKPNYGCKKLLVAGKLDLAKLNDRRSGNMAVRDAAGTLHSTLSYSAYDPYGRYKDVFNSDWSGKLGGSAPPTPDRVGSGAERSKSKSKMAATATAAATTSRARTSTIRAKKRLVGKGTILVIVPDEAEAGGDVPTYNVTNAIAAGLPSTQILQSSMLLRKDLRNTGLIEKTLLTLPNKHLLTAANVF